MIPRARGMHEAVPVLVRVRSEKPLAGSPPLHLAAALAGGKVEQLDYLWLKFKSDADGHRLRDAVYSGGERWPFVNFWRDIARENDIGRSQGVNASLNAIYVALRLQRPNT